MTLPTGKPVLTGSEKIEEVTAMQAVWHEKLRVAYYEKKSITKTEHDTEHSRLAIDFDIATAPDYVDEKPAKRAAIDGINNFGQLKAFLKKERGL